MTIQLQAITDCLLRDSGRRRTADAWIVGNQVDVKMFDTPAARAQTLEGLITQQALLSEARAKHITVPASEIQRSILSIEGLTGEDGKFDFERYQTLLAQQNMTPPMFEAQMRQDLALQQLGDAVQQTAIVPKAVVDRLFVLQESRRTLRTIARYTETSVPSPSAARVRSHTKAGRVWSGSRLAAPSLSALGCSWIRLSGQ